MHEQQLIPHLFRTESRKIVAVLCRLMGIHHLQNAEDIASETFASACETWPYRGIPENPVAWLYTVAKNKARNYLTRNQLFTTKIVTELGRAAGNGEAPEIDLSEQNITDSELRMLFAICHPCLAAEAQVGLALRILCGFGIEEIANAFLSNKETVNKRLFRAREKLRAENVTIAFPEDADLNGRLDAVLMTIYLLFSEGYHSESCDTVLRQELCLEAMRLNYLLIKNESTNLPAVNALFALMCFHTSRFNARQADNGQLILYNQQDESQWNQELIGWGTYFLHQASKGEMLSKYHLEANIACWHTVKEDTHEKWENILQLYNRLLQVAYSPVAALNRTFALSKTNGKMEAIAAAEKLPLTGMHFYHILLGELYAGIDNGKAIQHLQQAYQLAKTAADKQTILDKIAVTDIKGSTNGL